MRLTTKIISGVIGSIFILSLSFIIGFSFSERRHYRNYNRTPNISIPQDNQIEISLDPHRVIVIEEDYNGVRFEDEKRRGTMRINTGINSSSFTISQIVPDQENKLYISEALNGCIATIIHNDTLTIQIKDQELRKKYGKEDSITFISFSGVDLCLHISNVNIINKASGSVFLNNLETDSIVIDSRRDVLIESCKANFIHSFNNRLTVKNSVTKTMFIDLDRTRNWNIEGCEIENQIFTGSGRHNVTMHRNETGTINWHPKNPDAELNFKIPGEPIQIVFQ